VKIENKFLLTFVIPKLRFASTSFIATVVDYSLYLILVYSGFAKVGSNIFSASTGFLVNFFLQKKYIFDLRRAVSHTFLISFSCSLVGIAISSTLIYFLIKFAFFDYYQYITKLLVTGIMFFYNYYTKRWAFENTLQG